MIDRPSISKVLFSDESIFSISFGNQGPIVWRESGEAQNPSSLKSSVKSPQSVMVWGAVGPLCFIKLLRTLGAGEQQRLATEVSCDLSVFALEYII